MNQPVYIMHRKGKRKFAPCGKCGHPVRPGRKYSVDIIDSKIIYHAECFKLKYRS